MARRFFSLLLSCLFLLSTHARAADAQDVSSALAEFRYALQVEWDQADGAFYQSQLELFKARLLELRSQGVGVRELWEAGLSLHPDKARARQMDDVFQRFAHGPFEWLVGQRLMLQLAEEAGSEGASWAGRTQALVVFSFFFVAVVVLASGASDEAAASGEWH